MERHMVAMAGFALTAPAEYPCAACGYGMVVEDPSRNCPMCQATTWDSVTFAPLGHPEVGGPGADVIDLAEWRARRSR